MKEEGPGSKPLKQKKPKKLSASEREELLIDNFIGLQKVMINLSVKFENLSNNITKLLGVFEMSARDYMLNKGRTAGTEKDRDLLNQVNNLIDQNKAISRSIAQLDDKMKPKQPEFTQRTAPNQQVASAQISAPTGYEPSIQNNPFKPKTLQGGI